MCHLKKATTWFHEVYCGTFVVIQKSLLPNAAADAAAEQAGH